jgi:hypothetical protein
MKQRTLGLVLSFAIGVIASSAMLNAAALTYNRDIRPILSDNCFACHGPDKNKRKAKLRLDDSDSATGLKAIVAGKPDESEAIKRINSSDPKEVMPPPAAHKTLTDAQKRILRDWIQQGAVYEPHWAYIPPKGPAVPETDEPDWVRNPIDAFILRTLEDKKLSHSKAADRCTLLRRLSLDIIGLPPTPAELDAFESDKSPDAYEKQVDRLLSSPHYGERMAVPWLDEVRFADTVGFHGDQNQNVFPYRDYVIDAFNHNKPFDRFTVEQIAGDLLPHPTTEQLIATCFNRLNMVTREGGAQSREYLAKYMADRVRTISETFLGSTMNCCECHDHKYDPFTARDFYSMGAFFADVKQWGIYTDYTYTPNPELAGWTNDHPFPPELVVESPYLKHRRDDLIHQIDARVSAAHVDANAFQNFKSEISNYKSAHPDGFEYLSPIIGETSASEVQPVGDHALLFPATTAKPKSKRPMISDRVMFALPAGHIAAIRVELIPQPEHRDSIAADGSAGAMVQIKTALKSAEGGTHPLAIYFADADLKDDRFANGYSILGVTTGWKTAAEYSHQAQTATYLLDKSFDAKAGDQLVMTFTGPGCVRVSTSPIDCLDPRDPQTSEPALKLAYVLSTDSKATTELRRLQDQLRECRGGKSPVLVTVAVTPTATRILPRGNWQDESGAIVEPQVPHFLPQTSAAKGRRLNRLDLANWIVSPENPLTARVYVNRLWRHFFGTGISSSIEDLGTQGEWPSHPELLDWLAVEFRESGWDIKHMIRLIVMSSAYQQDSNLPIASREIDPGDRLISAQAPRRLDAEFVRDNALFASGLIDLEIGGPSAKPYQPAGYYTNIQFPDRKYIPDADQRQYRRGIYMHWQRSFLHPMLANFDAPSREDGVCTRIQSNTPQQALTLLNDPEFVEAARMLAQHVMSDSNDNQRLNAIYLHVLGRLPKDAERKSLSAFLAGQRDYYHAHADDAGKLISVGFAPKAADADPAELAAWTSVCRVVLNLHETITRY